MKEETQEEKDERFGCPDIDIVKLLDEYKVENSDEKVKKHQIDADVFMKMSEEDIGKTFDITKFGTKR